MGAYGYYIVSLKLAIDIKRINESLECLNHFLTGLIKKELETSTREKEVEVERH